MSDSKVGNGRLLDAVPIRNAGLVLLNSFLPMFFERLGLCKGTGFISNEAQQKAIHYLVYVYSGLTSAQEDDLVLNKILCGLPIDRPAGESFMLSQYEIELIDGMLKAVIGYWPAIGVCSINAFRGNWLIRSGLLREMDDKWELTVEKRAYDLLIHKSPFSLDV